MPATQACKLAFAGMARSYDKPSRGFSTLDLAVGIQGIG